jgi:hypothetical protein
MQVCTTCRTSAESPGLIRFFGKDRTFSGLQTGEALVCGTSRSTFLKGWEANGHRNWGTRIGRNLQAAAAVVCFRATAILHRGQRSAQACLWSERSMAGSLPGASRCHSTFACRLLCVEIVRACRQRCICKLFNGAVFTTARLHGVKLDTWKKNISKHSCSSLTEM